MRALTLTQPWATLVATSAKRIETRSWRTRYRGPLAIHAARSMPPSAFTFAMQLWERDLIPPPSELARGEVIAVGDLVAVDLIRQRYPLRGETYLRDHPDLELSADERAFGDFREWRWAWLLDNVVAIEPMRAQGRLGLWDWPEVPRLAEYQAS